MERTKIAERKLPDYTRGEEIFNSVTHIIGAAFGFVVLIACIIKAAYNHNVWGVAGGAIFGMCTIFLYSMSSIYHGLKISMAKRVFQVIDHCTIYILIIGTYAPMLLTKVREANPKFCLIFSISELVVATVGLVFTAIDFKKYQIISYAGYFIVGWSSVFAAKYVFLVFPKPFLYWIIAGGISYTFGMIFYARQRKHPYNHSVFHLFVLLGTVLHFIGIIVYCM